MRQLLIALAFVLGCSGDDPGAGSGDKATDDGTPTDVLTHPGAILALKLRE